MMNPSGTTRAGFVASVNVRPIAQTDGAGLERFYAELSDDSRAMRFLGATRPLDPARSQAFCSIDHEHREGFVAVIDDRDLGAERVVGHLCIEPDGRGATEMAIAVADSWQGLGIGRRLLDAGVVWARSAGVRRLVATAFISNARIVRLVRGLGLPVRQRWDFDGTCEMSIDLVEPAPLAA
jgi:GNAT superfamily N-acetyltransferase